MNRVNKTNRPLIEHTIINHFNKIVEKKGKPFISLIDKWDVEFAIQDEFNISDYMAGKMTFDILERGKKR
tara:strand:- start:421 stop:630 length:210 start_codon:yes stop_codon:yes gene_type:complete